MDAQALFIHLPSPFAPVTLHLPPTTHLSDISDFLPSALQSSNTDTYLRSRNSIPTPATPLSSLRHAANPTHPISLELCVRVRGGKGGFGSQLRAAGGRMSAGKSTNFDSCRDLSGRRLGTIKEAQRQAELLESAPALRAQAQAAEKAKLEALERSLGLSSAPSDSGAGEVDADGNVIGAGPSKTSGSGSGSKRLAELDLEELAKKKHKFEDNAFFEESREINESVRSAVSAGLLKKKKKPKTDTANASTTGTSAEDATKKAAPTKAATNAGAKSGAAQAKKAEKDKIAMPPPAAKATVA